MTPEMRLLILNADNPAQVFWRGDEIELYFVLDMTPEAHAAAIAKVTAHKLTFAGVIARVAGTPVCKCANPEALPTMILASAAYARHIAEAEQAPPDDSIAWLENLLKLEDPRDRN